MYGQYSNYNQNYDYYDKSAKGVPRYDQIELTERQNGKFAEPLIGDSSADTIVANEHRGCTDIVCAILIFLCIGAFVGLLIYGIITGNLLAVISVYNGAGVRCNSQSNFYCKCGIIQTATCLTSLPRLSLRLTLRRRCV